MIAPQREVLSNLIGEQRVSSNVDIRDLFRHLYERLLGIYDLIDSQCDLSNNVLEIIANQHAREIGEAVNHLTIISLVFLPFTFIPGLFDSGFFNVGETTILPIYGLRIVGLMITPNFDCQGLPGTQSQLKFPLNCAKATYNERRTESIKDSKCRIFF